MLEPRRVARTVLAEDDSTMVHLLSRLLSMEGFDVDALPVDADVVAAVAEGRPDILLLDMVFGRQNGLEVLDRVRQLPSAKELYVVMISGLNVREECLQHGADEFLLKPFMPDDLIALLHNGLQNPV
jgi:DNA-binding response OmpR family regulator